MRIQLVHLSARRVLPEMERQRWHDTARAYKIHNDALFRTVVGYTRNADDV